MSRRVVIKRSRAYEYKPLACQVIIPPLFSWMVSRCLKPQHKMLKINASADFPVCKKHHRDWLKGGKQWPNDWL